MSPIKLNGSTSGFVALDAPAAAGSNTLVLPTGNGTNGQVLTTNGSGALSWSTISSTQLGSAAAASGTNLQFNSGFGSLATAYGCRAWVNFNGVGAVSVRGHGNVSSISDNGFGDYAVNFITAMPDTNYAVVAMAEPSSVPGVGNTYYTVIGSNSSTLFTRTTSSAQIRTAYISTTGGASTLWDSEVVHVAIFR